VSAFAINPAETPRLFKSFAPTLKPCELSPLTFNETHPMKTQPVDWSQCHDVESAPDRLSGTWVLKGTRVPAQAIIDNAEDGYTAEQIATEIFDNLPLDRVRGVLRFAKLGSPSSG